MLCARHLSEALLVIRRWFFVLNLCAPGAKIRLLQESAGKIHFVAPERLTLMTG
jgi:hypothetical protein